MVILKNLEKVTWLLSNSFFLILGALPYVRAEMAMVLLVGAPLLAGVQTPRGQRCLCPHQCCFCPDYLVGRGKESVEKYVTCPPPSPFQGGRWGAGVFSIQVHQMGASLCALIGWQVVESCRSLDSRWETRNRQTWGGTPKFPASPSEDETTKKMASVCLHINLEP